MLEVLACLRVNLGPGTGENYAALRISSDGGRHRSPETLRFVRLLHLPQALIDVQAAA